MTACSTLKRGALPTLFAPAECSSTAQTATLAPMCGYRQSGDGREMGAFGFEEYLEVKAIIGLNCRR